MKKKELRELSEDELRAQYQTSKDELFNLRFQLATGQLDNTARIAIVRRDIARVMTYLQQAEAKRSGSSTAAGRGSRRQRRVVAARSARKPSDGARPAGA